MCQNTITLKICFYFFNTTTTTEIYTLSLHDALPIFSKDTHGQIRSVFGEVLFKTKITKNVRLEESPAHVLGDLRFRSEEHTSELQSRGHLVCRLLLEKKKIKKNSNRSIINNSCNSLA